MSDTYALTLRGRAVALTFRLRELFETLSESEQRRVLAELERLVSTDREPRVPLIGRITA